MSGPNGPNTRRATAAKPKKSARGKNAKTKTATAAAAGFAKANDSGPNGPATSHGN
jgi:hypothetical protein